MRSSPTAFERVESILGYGLLFEPTGEAPRPCVQHALGLPIIRGAGVQTDDPFFRATSAVCNIPTLTAAAQASGFLNAAPDPDGILRRAPLLMQYRRSRLPRVCHWPPSALSPTRTTWCCASPTSTPPSLGLEGQEVPLDGKSNLLLRYRGAKRRSRTCRRSMCSTGTSIPTSSAIASCSSGTTALGTREVVATPLDTLFVGVEVQATVADNLIQRDFMYRPEHGVTLETQVVIGLGTVTALVVARFGLIWGAIVSLSLSSSPRGRDRARCWRPMARTSRRSIRR